MYLFIDRVIVPLDSRDIRPPFSFVAVSSQLTSSSSPRRPSTGTHHRNGVRGPPRQAHSMRTGSVGHGAQGRSTDLRPFLGGDTDTPSTDEGPNGSSSDKAACGVQAAGSRQAAGRQAGWCTVWWCVHVPSWSSVYVSAVLVCRCTYGRTAQSTTQSTGHTYCMGRMPTR